jgi:hypothetical protein
MNGMIMGEILRWPRRDLEPTVSNYGVLAAFWVAIQILARKAMYYYALKS